MTATTTPKDDPTGEEGFTAVQIFAARREDGERYFANIGQI
ncbi:MAG: hypothetical protein ABWZ98_00225 [Nakamurella sp.]